MKQKDYYFDDGRVAFFWPYEASQLIDDNKPVRGPKGLLYALLVDTIHCATGNVAISTSRYGRNGDAEGGLQREKEEALHFIRDMNPEPWGFRWVCEQLDIDAEKLRDEMDKIDRGERNLPRVSVYRSNAHGLMKVRDYDTYEEDNYQAAKRRSKELKREAA